MPDCRVHQEFEHHLLLATPDGRQLFQVSRSAYYQDDSKTGFLLDSAQIEHVITPAPKPEVMPEKVSVPAAVLDRVAKFRRAH